MGLSRTLYGPLISLLLWRRELWAILSLEGKSTWQYHADSTLRKINKRSIAWETTPLEAPAAVSQIKPQCLSSGQSIGRKHEWQGGCAAQAKRKCAASMCMATCMHVCHCGRVHVCEGVYAHAFAWGACGHIDTYVCVTGVQVVCGYVCLKKIIYMTHDLIK